MIPFQKNSFLFKIVNGFLFFSIISINFLLAQSAFIENKGQWQDEVLFKSDFNGGNLYIEKNQLNFNFFDTEDLDKFVYKHHKKNLYEVDHQQIINGHCLKTSFVNANTNSSISASNPINEYFNYYLGNKPKKWASKVNAYNLLTIKDLYTGIDLKLMRQASGYKYDFIVKPNANTEQILIAYLGAENIRIENGNLNVKTSVNEMIEFKPFAYQIVNNKQVEVKCHFEIVNNKVKFNLPDSYDSSLALVIDPYIVFSRYSGSFADNFGYTATYDSDENAYGAGSVFGPGYITTPGAFDINYNGDDTDIGIVKYSADGLQRIYSTYLGGNQTDLPHSIVVNSRDELYLLGTSSSLNFPIDTFSTAISANFNGGNQIGFTGLGVNYQNGSDMVIARFSVDGTSLLASSFLGGSGNDGLNSSTFLKYNYADEIRGEILIDANDNCYVVSCTSSTDFPIINGTQSTNAGGLDAIVVKMDENLTAILWSSYLGGAADDAAYSLDFDLEENLVIAGGTQSLDFPMMNAYQNTYGGARADGFISKLHKSGTGILSSTYYGSSDYDQIYFVEVNDLNQVHIFGQTKAPADELIFNAAYNKPNGGQLLAKFNPAVDTLIWSTRFGDESGIPDISPTAFLVDVCNRIFLSGWGWNADIMLSGTNGLDVSADAVDNTTDNQDFYFMVLQDDASSLVYGSFFGGQFSREHVDGGTSRFDKKGVVYQAVCAGCGGQQDFPTVPSDSIGIWTNNNSNCNLGVVKYAFSPPSIIADFSVPPTDCAPTTLTFTNQSQTAFDDTSQTTFFWVVNGDTTTSYHLDFNFATSGVYNINLIAIDTQSCNFIDSVSKQITILGNGFSTLPDAGLCDGNMVQIGINPLPEPNVVYSWSPNYFLSATNIANPFANPPVDTIYQLIVSNGNCTDTFTQRIVLGNIEVNLAAFDTPCLETFVEISADNIPGAIYDWQPEELILTGQGSSTVSLYAENINQEFTLAITDLNGCKDFISTNIITINDLPDLSLSADPDTLETGQGSQLLAESISAINFLWQETIHFNTLDITNPYAKDILETTTFLVEAHNGICPKRDSITVYVVVPDCLEGKFYVPNAFSPNGDGNNDVFKVRTTLVNIEKFYFAVYDRWGNKVFSTTDKTQGWNGKYKGKELSPNVYGWYTEGVCPNGEDYFLKGNVTLLK